MEGLPREIIVGAIGSILGALIYYLGQSGIQLSKTARETALQKRKKEEEEWKTMKMGIRQGITNSYLFSILRYLFLGNLLWLVPEVISEPAKAFGMGWSGYIFLILVSKGGALCCFFLGLGKIMRYQKLRALDEND